jgi:hypothetical protein
MKPYKKDHKHAASEGADSVSTVSLSEFIEEVLRKSEDSSPEGKKKSAR